MKTVEKGTNFEVDVCSILYQTNPYSISHYNGGADRGRDILVQYKVDQVIYDVIVECKCYEKSVGKEIIMPSLDWAKVHKPAILYLWIKPYLTPATKDYIEKFSDEYGITILYEEELNINKYNTELEKEMSIIFSNLREKIIDSLKNSKYTELLELEYESQIENTDHYLADREWERNILMGSKYEAYYIQGVSACGKTQLLKNIAFVYKQKGYEILWHTIRDEESERQTEAFYLALSHFFKIHYNDERLQMYLKDHGYFLSNELITIITTVLTKFHPIIVIDDIHKCSSENFILKNTFETIISERLCRIYFIGWFNIFSRTVHIVKNLKTIILDGLLENYLDEIIVHHIGQSRKSIATLIQKKYNGLPGYAVLVDSQTNIEDLISNETFLHSFVDCLKQDEKKTLFILTYASYPIGKKHFFNFDLLESLASLVEKRLVENIGLYYKVHDKYKPFLKNYSINRSEFQKIINVLTVISDTEPIMLLDIIGLYKEHGMLEEAYSLLCKSFSKLLHLQLIKKTLIIVQDIEEHMIDNCKLIELCKMKIILLERLSQYSLCVQYLALIENDVDFFSPSWEKIYYIKLRCCYFRNEYDELLISFYKNRNYIFIKMDKELKIQILLLIGRVYYIRGDLETALMIYLLGYQYAIMSNKITLIVKAIHRIAMIEFCKGLFSESQTTFLYLTKLETIITPKRKSYAYYRIAKCYYSMNQLEESLYYTKESLSIKESYNDERGKLFSYKMLAKIYFKKHDTINAMFYINKAMNIANNLDLTKERLAVNLVLVDNILKYEIEYDEKEIEDLLRDCLEIAVKQKLLFRIGTIIRLANKKMDRLSEQANKQYQIIKCDLEKNISNERNLFDQYLSEKNKAFFYRLQEEGNAITSHLLINATIAPTKLKELRIDIDNI